MFGNAGGAILIGAFVLVVVVVVVVVAAAAEGDMLAL